jgi:hypothetical protein
MPVMVDSEGTAIYASVKRIFITQTSVLPRGRGVPDDAHATWSRKSGKPTTLNVAHAPTERTADEASANLRYRRGRQDLERPQFLRDSTSPILSATRPTRRALVDLGCRT